MEASLTPDIPLPASRLEVGKPYLTMTHRRSGPGGAPEDLIWLGVRLDEDWVAAYRFVPQDGKHVIAEVRVVPIDAVPAGGLPLDKLRSLQTDGMLRAVQEILEYKERQAGREYLERVLPRFELDLRAMMDVVPRRHRRSDVDVARAAAAYAAAPRNAKRRAIAKELSYSLSNASKLIKDARDRGFLTASGELTEKACGVLTPVGRSSA